METLEANEYMIRRKLLTLFGAKFHIYDTNGNVVGFSRQKAFKLKEDIRIYTDKSESTELIIIQARQIVDFSAAYDVVDSSTGTKLGALRRKGWASIIRDSWELLDMDDRPFGKIEEDSTAMALLRRFLTNLIPQRFNAISDGGRFAIFKQRFNPFVFKLDVTLLPSARDMCDPKLILAAGILLAAIEGRQE